MNFRVQLNCLVTTNILVLFYQAQHAKVLEKYICSGTMSYSKCLFISHSFQCDFKAKNINLIFRSQKGSVQCYQDDNLVSVPSTKGTATRSQFIVQLEIVQKA